MTSRTDSSGTGKRGAYRRKDIALSDDDRERLKELRRVSKDIAKLIERHGALVARRGSIIRALDHLPVSVIASIGGTEASAVSRHRSGDR